MKIVKKIFKKLINFYLFRRKIFRSNFKKNNNYFEKNELLLSNYLNTDSFNYENYNEENDKLSALLAQFFRSNNFTLRDFSRLVSGKIIYNRTGITPDNIQQLLVESYSKSNGLIQDILHEFLYKECIQPNSNSLIESEIFGKVSTNEIDSIVNMIKHEGYVILPKLVPSEKIEQIKKWSYNIKYNIVDNFEKRYQVDNLNFDNPNCVTANAIENDLLNNAEINNLIFDPVIISIISKYLGIEKPSLIHLCMWWTFKSKNEFASSEAAQLYHYDLDHIKWLKVFFYLTDVGIEQGPHVYIPSSHIAGNKNYHLLERGYSRVSDSEMQKFQKSSSRKVIGSAGSVIIGDTKCFHKGTPVIKGARLVLQPTFGPSNLLKTNKI